MAAISAPPEMAGARMGRLMRLAIVHLRAPSIWAASSNEGSMERKAASVRKKTKAMQCMEMTKMIPPMP